MSWNGSMPGARKIREQGQGRMTRDDDSFRDRYVFDASELPPGFRLPERYVSLMNSQELPDLMPWWFLGERRQAADGWLSILREQYPARRLVPFAQRDDENDTIAAFATALTRPAGHACSSFTRSPSPVGSNGGSRIRSTNGSNRPIR